jgi:glucose-1-phosphate adenylyltransferase
MDFRQLIKTHRETKADATIAVLPVPRHQVEGFGIVRVDESGRVIGFVEKPKTDEQLAPVRMSDEWLAQHGVQGTGRPYLASMGIYVFNRDALLHLLTAKPLATDFGKEVFPRSVRSHNIQAHVFDGYWEDLGTVKAYHEASLALASDNPPFDFHSPEGVIYTRMRFLPASRISAASVKQSLISDGCIVQEGTFLERCIVGVRSRIGRNVVLRDTVFIGADRFETDQERKANRQRGLPDLGIGENSVIENAIIDKDCRIGRNVRITNHCGMADTETDSWVIREGIIAIPRGTIIPDGTVI